MSSATNTDTTNSGPTSTDPHDNPQGPGDARPTDKQIVEKEGDAATRLKGKKVLITGASGGLGLQTAKTLASIGCDLYLPLRDISKQDDVKKQIESAAGGHAGVIEFFYMDLSDLDSIRSFVGEVKKKTDRINILIENAATTGMDESYTKQGYEMQFGSNHLGHFLLFLLLRPLLLAAVTPEFNTRVVILSSGVHTRCPLLFGDYNQKKAGYNKFKAYAQCKSANIAMALEVERRYGNQGIHAWSLNPGLVATGLARNLTDEERQKLFSDPSYVKIRKSIEQGAATQVWAAIAKELEGQGGKYLDNCRVARNVPGEEYAAWAYDSEVAQRLWTDSLTMVNETE